MKGKNILIACSSLDCILIDKILGEKFTLERAGNDKDIMKCMNEKLFDLLLVDINILRRIYSGIQGIVKKMNLPVIALSSEPDDARNKIMMSQLGCCACYIRPIRQDYFIPFVNYWIKQYPIRDTSC